MRVAERGVGEHYMTLLVPGIGYHVTLAFVEQGALGQMTDKSDTAAHTHNRAAQTQTQKDGGSRERAKTY